MLFTPMAGVAGDALVAVEIRLIDLPNHRQHLPRDYFVIVFVAREISLNMASAAAHAEPDRKCPHGRHHFIGFQDFEILRRTHWSATATGPTGGRLLSKRNRGENEYR
jgi:hypothetical protein